MRLLILALATAVLLGAAPAARAAPTCLDSSGQVVRCGTPGAMPVGWRLPAQQAPERPAGPSLSLLASLGLVIGGLFALIALMPEFDGGRWDAQEGDDDERP